MTTTPTPNEYRIETTVRETGDRTLPDGTVSVYPLDSLVATCLYADSDIAARIKPGAKVTLTVELTPAAERVNAFDAARDRRTVDGVEIYGVERRHGGAIRTYGSDDALLTESDATDSIYVDAL